MQDLAALAGVVLGQEDLGSTLAEVCRIAVRAVPGAEGASMTTLERGRPSSPAASDDWAQGLDEMQFAEHEGPCLDCTRTGNVFRIRDTRRDDRWPFYLPAAAGRGARSILSLPMAAEGRVVGALNLYARQPDAFDAEAVSVGEVIAAHAGLAMQVASAFFGHRALAENLRRAIESRAVIEQAKGVVMAREQCDAEAAFQLLVAESQRANRKLRDVAGDVVTSATSPR